MNYLITVLADRIQAEAAYIALEKEGILMENVTILGKGYCSADEYGLIDPMHQARQQVRLMALWLVPFGFFAGACFNLITQLDTFAWAGEIGRFVVSGLVGALSGLLGSVFVGGGVGLIVGGADALPYRNRLDAGQYLIVVKGSELLTRRISQILRSFNPESIQSYLDPDQI